MWVCVAVGRMGAAPQGPVDCGSCLRPREAQNLLPVRPAPGPEDIPKTLVRAVAPPLATMPCPLCAGIRGVMPPPLFPMSWKKWAG